MWGHGRIFRLIRAQTSQIATIKSLKPKTRDMLLSFLMGIWQVQVNMITLNSTGISVGYRIIDSKLVPVHPHTSPHEAEIKETIYPKGPYSYMGGCQHYGPFLGTLNMRCRIIIGIQKGTIVLTTTHIMYTWVPKKKVGIFWAPNMYYLEGQATW